MLSQPQLNSNLNRTFNFSWVWPDYWLTPQDKLWLRRNKLWLHWGTLNKSLKTLALVDFFNIGFSWSNYAFLDVDGAKYNWVWFCLVLFSLVGLVCFVECSILAEEEYCHNPNSTPTSTEPSTSVELPNSNNNNKNRNNSNHSWILKMGWLSRFIYGLLHTKWYM